MKSKLKFLERTMREELPKKPLFIHSQDWYRTTICVDCPEFNFIPLPEGAVAYCNRIETDQSCIFFNTESGDEEKGLDTQTLLNLESMPKVEAE